MVKAKMGEIKGKDRKSKPLSQVEQTKAPDTGNIILSQHCTIIPSEYRILAGLTAQTPENTSFTNTVENSLYGFYLFKEGDDSHFDT